MGHRTNFEIEVIFGTHRLPIQAVINGKAGSRTDRNSREWVNFQVALRLASYRLFLVQLGEDGSFSDYKLRRLGELTEEGERERERGI